MLVSILLSVYLFVSGCISMRRYMNDGIHTKTNINDYDRFLCFMVSGAMGFFWPVNALFICLFVFAEVVLSIVDAIMFRWRSRK